MRGASSCRQLFTALAFVSMPFRFLSLIEAQALVAEDRGKLIDAVELFQASGRPVERVRLPIRACLLPVGGGDAPCSN